MQQMQNLEPDQDTGSTGLSGPEMRDRAFLRDAYSDGLAEIQMGKLALEKSSNSDVKAYAQMMIDDHTEINEKIEPIAQSTGVTLVKGIGKSDQAEYNKLKDMSGDAFDKEYAVYAAASHRLSQRSFRVEVAVAPVENGLKQQVAESLITIHKHFQAAQKLVGDVGATMPPRPPFKK
jgi:putative membrane protein